MTGAERKIQMLGAIIVHLATQRHLTTGGFDSFPEAAIDCGMSPPQSKLVVELAEKFAAENGVLLGEFPPPPRMIQSVLNALYDGMKFTDIEVLNRLTQAFRDNFFEHQEFSGRISAYNDLVFALRDAVAPRLLGPSLRHDIIISWKAGIAALGSDAVLPRVEPLEILAVGEAHRCGRVKAGQPSESVLAVAREEGFLDRWTERFGWRSAGQ